MVALGRIHKPDSRDLLFLAQAPPSGIELPPAQPRTHPWHLGPKLDQGNHPSCVGFGWRNWANAAPIMDRPNVGPDGFSIYTAAQKLDGIPLPHEGSTVRAGAQVMQQLGYIKNYLWITSVDELKEWVTTRTPIVMGTDWYTGMFTTDPRGLVSVSGQIEGGHCYLAYWHDPKLDAFECYNQWKDWGLHNSDKFYIRTEDMAQLLAENGEACAAVESKHAIVGIGE